MVDKKTKLNDDAVAKFLAMEEAELKAKTKAKLNDDAVAKFLAMEEAEKL